MFAFWVCLIAVAIGCWQIASTIGEERARRRLELQRRYELEIQLLVRRHAKRFIR